jgi:hypothetical protein
MSVYDPKQTQEPYGLGSRIGAWSLKTGGRRRASRQGHRYREQAEVAFQAVLDVEVVRPHPLGADRDLSEIKIVSHHGAYGCHAALEVFKRGTSAAVASDLLVVEASDASCKTSSRNAAGAQTRRETRWFAACRNASTSSGQQQHRHRRHAKYRRGAVQHDLRRSELQHRRSAQQVVRGAAGVTGRGQADPRHSPISNAADPVSIASASAPDVR